MIGNVRHCRDDAVLQFYQKNCALNIGLLLGNLDDIFYTSSGIDFSFARLNFLGEENRTYVVFLGRAKSLMLKCGVNG